MGRDAVTSGQDKCRKEYTVNKNRQNTEKLLKRK